MLRKLLCMAALAGSFLLPPPPPAEAAQAVQTVGARPYYHRYRRHYAPPYYHRHYGYGPYYRPYGYRHR